MNIYLKNISSILLLLYLFSHADYFGENKVQYDDFKFQILRTENFDIHYYPAESIAVNFSGKSLELWHRNLYSIFQNPLPENQPIIFYSGYPDFMQTNAVGGMIQQGVGGLTEFFFNRIIIPLTGIRSEDEHVLGHELTHAFQFSLMRSALPPSRITGNLPLWFIEGMAEYCSIGSRSPETAMWLRDAVVNNDLPSINALSNTNRYFPYRFGHALWTYITGRFGDDIINPLFCATVSSNFHSACKEILGIEFDSLSSQWSKDLFNIYCKHIEGKQNVEKIGKVIIDDGNINLSPVVNPDGNIMAILSSRDLTGIDLFFVNTENGKVIKRQYSYESDMHFESPKFTNSTGAWSTDGSLFIFPVLKEGKNSLALLNPSKRGILKIISIPLIEEINGLTWSPDGKKLAFSGTYGAICNLYTYDLSTGQCNNITCNTSAAIQPSWSPDGMTIAFSTDMKIGSYDTSSKSLMSIALYNVRSGQTRYLQICPWAKHICPHFSPDSKALYFISDPDGFSNIYKYSFDTEIFYKVTNTSTGITGLSGLSPAMSIAKKTGKLVFSVFHKRRFTIHSLELNQCSGTPFTIDYDEYCQNIQLPPISAAHSIVDSYLDNTQSPGILAVSRLKFTPKLKLLYVGQLSAGITITPTGIGAGGALHAVFSDMLGDHLLGTGIEVVGKLNDAGLQFYYLNFDKRFTKGISVHRLPYINNSAEITDDTATINDVLYAIKKITYTQNKIFDNRIRFISYYPFSRNRRAEFNYSFTHLSFKNTVDQISVLNDMVINENTEQKESISSINLFENQLAYVGDFAVPGYISPIAGRRYRFGIEPTIGSLFYVAFRADYRQYIHLHPLTVALRLFHYGRYFRDAEDNHLPRFFVGNDLMVRGYLLNTYDLNYDLSDSPILNYLSGSRAGVMNLEMRLHLTGSEEYSLINFPWLPSEFVLFLDAGTAWNKKSHPKPILSSHVNTRMPIFSAGFSLRVNILGLIILQTYAAFPFQLPSKQWRWGIFTAPGW